MKSLVIVVAILAVILLATLAYLFTPSVYAARTAQGVTVHFETLGEYPSDIDRIEVVQKGSGRIVWRATSQGEMFQLDRFQLMPGSNISSLNPSYGRVKTEIPAHGSFTLQRGSPIEFPCVSKGGPTYAGTRISFLAVVDQWNCCVELVTRMAALGPGCVKTQNLEIFMHRVTLPDPEKIA